MLRTDLYRFKNLKDYSFKPNYMELLSCNIGNVRMHYIDEGDPKHPTVVLLHGEPTWSYLYRHMIEIIVAEGFRVLVPDLIGFGKSDKPELRSAYTFSGHVEWFLEWLGHLDISNISFFGQDWGGLIGLRALSHNPNLFKSVMLANTAFPIGENELGNAFKAWRNYSQVSHDFKIGNIVHRGTFNGLSVEEIAAYDAPFPSEAHKAGARQFPLLVPIEENDPECIKQVKAWRVLKTFKKPFLTCFSDNDPIMKGQEKSFIKSIPGAWNVNHFITQNAGHFLQEDAGEFLAAKLVSFINNAK